MAEGRTIIFVYWILKEFLRAQRIFIYLQHKYSSGVASEDERIKNMYS